MAFEFWRGDAMLLWLERTLSPEDLYGNENVRYEHYWYFKAGIISRTFREKVIIYAEYTNRMYSRTSVQKGVQYRKNINQGKPRIDAKDETLYEFFGHVHRKFESSKDRGYIMAFECWPIDAKLLQLEKTLSPEDYNHNEDVKDDHERHMEVGIKTGTLREKVIRYAYKLHNSEIPGPYKNQGPSLTIQKGVQYRKNYWSKSISTKDETLHEFFGRDDDEI